ncbi:DgyrCDS6257 [Dimorphilus gyrociliatus]|uniref:Repressor of RNA polymerase III transcription MAF1 n=1 Tax=Dimorphilus gyrociliatus TaxID=2664684 RepID=A0A7I8VQC0_9ANNE|nr:DgyrCDS6257 [Dimorphilus gyrociliatus]
MKFLENAKFEAVNNLLCFETGEYIVEGRIESYSCKMTGQDKRLFRVVSSDQKPSTLQALSPPESAQVHGPHHSPGQCSRSISSDNGVLCDTVSTKTLFYLISTLNESFHPDYDFSQAKSHEFSREPSVQWVVDAVDNQLPAAAGPRNAALIKDRLWGTLDEEIQLNDCDIYSYNPDLSSDPYGEEGCVCITNTRNYDDDDDMNLELDD